MLKIEGLILCKPKLFMINVVFLQKHLEKTYLIILLVKDLLFVKLIALNQNMEQ